MVIQEVSNVVLNWSFGLGFGLGWVMGFVTVFTLYVVWKIFPKIDGYINLANSYTKFLRETKDDGPHLKKYRALFWIVVAILVCVALVVVIR